MITHLKLVFLPIAFGLVASAQFMAQSVPPTDSLLRLIQLESDPQKKAILLLKRSELGLAVDFDRSAEDALAAIDQFRNRTKNDSLLARALMAHSRALMYKAQYDAALKSLNEANILVKQRNDSSAMAAAAAALGVLYLNQSQYASAKGNLLSAVELYDRIGNKESSISSLMNVGLIYSYKGDYDSAAYFYYRALSKADSIGNKKLQSYAQNNIAYIHYAQEEWLKAKELFQHCVNMGHQLEDAILLSDSYFMLGRTCFKIGEVDSAITYCSNAIAIDEKQNNVRGLAVKWVDLGEMKEQQGLLSEALLNYEKGLQFAKRVEDNHQILPKILIKLAAIKRLQGKKPDAKRHLKQAINIADSIDDKPNLAAAYLELSKLYESQNKYNVSLAYYMKHDSVKTLVVNESKNRALGELELKYESQKKQLEIERLNNEKRVAEAEVRAKVAEVNRGNIMVGALLLIGLLLAVLLYQIWRNYKTKERDNQRLFELNRVITERGEQLQRALSEKEILLKEIHHRVKNNLQVISSLLNLQASGLSDSGVKDAMREGQSRVKSIALIHQKLYQGTELGAVNFTEYAKQLVGYLEATFKTSVQGVKTQFSGDDLLLDIDTAVPLGLILNEIITNCYKYAFTGTEGGVMRIETVSISEHVALLRVADNGPGFGAEFSKSSVHGMGTKLISILSRQLKGNVEYRTEKGGVVEVRFKNRIRPSTKIEDHR